MMACTDWGAISVHVPILIGSVASAVVLIAKELRTRNGSS